MGPWLRSKDPSGLLVPSMRNTAHVSGTSLGSEKKCVSVLFSVSATREIVGYLPFVAVVVTWPWHVSVTGCSLRTTTSEYCTISVNPKDWAIRYLSLFFFFFFTHENRSLLQPRCALYMLSCSVLRLYPFCYPISCLRFLRKWRVSKPTCSCAYFQSCSD